MNSTLCNTAVNTWKRVNVQHVTLVCGLVVAAIAIVAIEAPRGETAAPPISPARATISAPRFSETPQFTLFIAGSQQQADDYAAAIRQDLNPVWFASYSFVAVTNSEEEVKFRSLRDGISVELASVGTDFGVVDLRGQ